MSAACLSSIECGNPILSKGRPPFSYLIDLLSKLAPLNNPPGLRRGSLSVRCSRRISLRLEFARQHPSGLAHVNPLLKISCREVGTPAPGSAPGPPSALGHSGQGLTGLLTPSPVSRRSDCMIWNVVV